MVRVTPWTIVLGLTLGLGLWFVASVVPALNRPRLARRVAPYVLDISAGARELVTPPPPGPLPVVGILFEPLIGLARAVLAAALGGSEQVRRRLRQSASPLTVEGFRSQQLLAGVGGAALGLLLAVFSSNAPLAVRVAMVVAAGVAGVLAREWLLQRAARARLRRLSDELPVILEFLTLSLSAGEGILDALRRIGAVSAGELAGELSGVVARVATGLPLADTLDELAEDLDLPPFSRTVEQLVAALERGTPLVEVLRAQAQDARDDARRELLEIAGRKEIAMMVPLVFLILPVTILFALFPGVFVLQVGF